MPPSNKKQKCQRCKRSIAVFGDRRKNGKAGLVDWGAREYHKKCWREQMLEKELDRILEAERAEVALAPAGARKLT